MRIDVRSMGFVLAAAALLGSASCSQQSDAAKVPALHRAEAIVCAVAVTDSGAVMSDGGSRDPTGADGAPITCTMDSDCPACANGHTDRCLALSCKCDECSRDEDCGATGVCSCSGQSFGFARSNRGSVCVPADCRSDADCGAGGFCSPTVSFDCGVFYGVAGFYCHTADDKCRNDSDCATGDCRYSPQAGIWVCATGACAG
jgi:hypothetical protein